MNKVTELATGLQHSLFATRDTVEEAFTYAYSVVESLPDSDKAAVYTAMHVLVNTIAEEFKQLSGE